MLRTLPTQSLMTTSPRVESPPRTRAGSACARWTTRRSTSTSRSTRTSIAASRRALPISTRADMTAKARLDNELVRRGLARSRQHAQELVAAGLVSVSGIPATKPATGVDPAASVRVVPPPGESFVSRGGTKLAGALDDLGGPDPAGRRCLDAGASTGGFTDVLLRRGAREGGAGDGGYRQVGLALPTDPPGGGHRRTEGPE